MQRSTTQLIREVEELETKLDGRLVELRHELARLDVSYDALQTAVRAVSDEQKQLPALSRKVRPDITKIILIIGETRVRRDEMSRRDRLD